MPSENGWEPARAGADMLEWRQIPGAEVSLQFLKGWPSTVMTAYAADYHAYIEPLRDADSAAYTPTNSVATSNHLNGTAMDLNWNSHPFQVDYAGFDGPKIQRMRELQAFYTFDGLLIVFWAQDWDSPKDAMHHQMGYNTWNNPKVLEFIKQRIRPDGFSTYKRGGIAAPPPPPPPPPAVEDGAIVLSKVMGGSVSLDRYRELLPGFRDCVLRCNAATPKRINMLTAQLGHESGGLKYMEEIASGAAYEGRDDLGNTQPGDGVRFKGRGPIQITGRHNYTMLSKWAFDQKFAPTPTFFVDHPEQLATPQYGFLGAVWYWTVARPNINALCDADDLEGVTRAINGGLNGLEDRRNRLNRARSMDLAPIMRGGPPPPQDPTQSGDDFMSELTGPEQREVLTLLRWLAAPGTGELRKLFPSRSGVREPGEGLLDTLAGLLSNTDGNADLVATFLRALVKYPKAIERLQRVANGGEPGRSPDDALVAQAMLSTVGKLQRLLDTGPSGAVDRSVTVAPPVAPGPTAAQIADQVLALMPAPDHTAIDSALREIQKLREENAMLRVQKAEAVAAPSTDLAKVNGAEPTSGELVGGVVDSVSTFAKHALALDTVERATLNTAIETVTQIPPK